MPICQVHTHIPQIYREHGTVMFGAVPREHPAADLFSPTWDIEGETWEEYVARALKSWRSCRHIDWRARCRVYRL
jgi:hypothetical protein